MWTVDTSCHHYFVHTSSLIKTTLTEQYFKFPEYSYKALGLWKFVFTGVTTDKSQLKLYIQKQNLLQVNMPQLYLLLWYVPGCKCVMLNDCNWSVKSTAAFTVMYSGDATCATITMHFLILLSYSKPEVWLCSGSSVLEYDTVQINIWLLTF